MEVSPSCSFAAGWRTSLRRYIEVRPEARAAIYRFLRDRIEGREAGPNDLAKIAAHSARLTSHPPDALTR